MTKEGKEKYMHGLLEDVTEENIASWLSPDNLRNKETKTFSGFELVNSIDGGVDPRREVTLARITGKDKYPQHVHLESDALFVIISGEAFLLSAKDRKRVKAGDRIEVPRGMPHGFEIAEDATLEFVTVQSPPIRNRETDEYDFHELTDFV